MTANEGEIAVMLREHFCVMRYLRYKQVPSPPSICRKKNAEDSKKYRVKGNELYTTENHSEKIHEIIWKLYTQSIALAPNKSHELALGYGNRSALLFHLEKFEDCVKDCDRALNITKCDFFKAKLLTRKAECLFLMGKSSAEEVCNEAKQILETLELDEKVLKSYADKLKDILSACNIPQSKGKSENKKEKKNNFEELSNFPRSEEVPCASKSVAIKYEKNWGRHIVAAKDIKPGEILALEKRYFTFIITSGLYLFCSNCAQYVWSSIPCKNCIHGIYCSESCRSEAWEKYHKWECSIFPFIWDIEEDINAAPSTMRLALIALNEVGGIDNMRNLLVELDSCKDPRTKGFLEGVFHSDSIRSIFSLTTYSLVGDPAMEMCITEESCIAAELLAKHTTFFGRKMRGLSSEIFKNKDVLFVAALMVYIQKLKRNNCEYYSVKEIDYLKPVPYVTTLGAFSSLLNHSCDPNLRFILARNNTLVIFALKPIKKGTQLAYSYIGRHFLDNKKEKRQHFLKQAYKIDCQCLPCIENWSNICLPNIKIICEVTPALHRTMLEIYNKMQKIKRIRNAKNVVYSPKLMQDVKFFLETMTEKITIYCADCFDCMELLEEILRDVFGSFYFDVPHQCYLR